MMKRSKPAVMKTAKKTSKFTTSGGTSYKTTVKRTKGPKFNKSHK